MVQNWADAIRTAWDTIWNKLVNFFPNILGSLLILLVGWVIAVLLERIIVQLFRIIGIQTLSERFRLEDSLKKMGTSKTFSELTGALVKWLVFVITFLAAVSVLNLSPISDFFERVLAFVPHAVAAGGILLIGVVLANFMANFVMGILKGAEFGFSELVATLIKYAIVIFAALAALSELQVAQILIQTLFTGLVALLAIAGGLAFGLGGTDAAKGFIEKVQKAVNYKK